MHDGPECVSGPVYLVGVGSAHIDQHERAESVQEHQQTDMGPQCGFGPQSSQPPHHRYV